MKPNLSKVRPVAGTATGMLRCGFCISGVCDKCPGGIEHAGGLIWKCGCNKHPLKLRCLDCGNTDSTAVDAQRFRCTNKQDCTARAQKRLDDNPVIQTIREITHVTDTAATEKPTTGRKPKVPTVGYCVHCNAPTKGGKFAAGHDARWIAELVRDVLANRVDGAAARAKIEQLASAALVAKFDKSLSNQRAKAARAQLAEEAVHAENLAADEAAALDAASAPDSDGDGIEDEVLGEPDEDDFDDEDGDEDEPEPEPEPVKPVARRTSLRKSATAATPAAKPAVRRRSTPAS